MVSGIGSIGNQASYTQAASRAPSAKEMISRADADGDGKLSLEELDTMLKQGPPQGPQGAPPPGPPPPAGGPRSATELIEQFDGDGDGMLNEEEALSMAEALRAEMEEMMARFTIESGQSDPAYLTAALESYALNTADELSAASLSVIG